MVCFARAALRPFRRLAEVEGIGTGTICSADLGNWECLVPQQGLGRLGLLRPHGPRTSILGGPT